MNLTITIITLAIMAGQLIRIPIGSGGVTLLDTIVLIFCMLGFVKVKFHLKKPPKFIFAAFIFILAAITSLILTPLHLQFSEYVISFFYIIRFSSYILFAWLIYADAFGGFKEQIISILISSGFGLAILGLLQFIFLPDLQFLASSGWDPHYFRTVSTFFDPNFAGAFFVLTLLLIYQNFLSAKKRKINKLGLFTFALLFIALLLTFSRSSYGMFFVSFFLLGLLFKNSRTAVAAIVLTSVLFFGFRTYSKVVSQPLNIDRTASATSRISSWQQGWKIFASAPILGVGYNTYRFALKQYNLAPEDVIKNRGGSTNDSSLLFVAATTGIVGLFAYLGFLISILVKGFKENKILTAALLGAVAHSTFANSLFYPHILIWIILACVSKSPLEKV